MKCILATQLPTKISSYIVLGTFATVDSWIDPLGDKTDTITALQEGTGNTIMSKAGVRLAPMKLTV